jgi:hypothetical protein
MILTIQYLEDSPDLEQLSPRAAAEKLRLAGSILPITHVLIGWHLSEAVLAACREEAQRMNAMFYRWHPLLTGDGEFTPRPEWQVVGLGGQRIPGFKGLPEFTFTCPNHPAVEHEVLDHLEQVIKPGNYDGFFLDRVRFPSPAYDPANTLGCFCEFCRQKAADQGLNLAEVRRVFQQLPTTVEGKKVFIQSLLMKVKSGQNEPSLLERFFRFRAASVTRLVNLAAERARSAGAGVALDCFSPSLARMVGQDLSILGQSVEWIKVMSYAHALGPAGLPFEIIGLLDFLIPNAGSGEGEAMQFLGKVMNLSLPTSRTELFKKGLSPQALKAESARGVMTSSAPLIAGMELVDIPGVSELSEEQIKEDLRAILGAGPAGIALSWDLQLISRERLEITAEVLKSTPLVPLQHC